MGSAEVQVEREFVSSIGATAGEEEQQKNVLCQGCGAGPERIGQEREGLGGGSSDRSLNIWVNWLHLHMNHSGIQSLQR